jgi:hypothetical protein
MHMHVTKAGEYRITGVVKNGKFGGGNGGTNGVSNSTVHRSGDDLRVRHKFSPFCLKKCPADGGKTFLGWMAGQSSACRIYLRNYSIFRPLLSMEKVA